MLRSFTIHCFYEQYHEAKENLSCNKKILDMAEGLVRHSNYQDFDESLHIGVLFYDSLQLHRVQLHH